MNLFIIKLLSGFLIIIYDGLYCKKYKNIVIIEDIFNIIFFYYLYLFFNYIGLFNFLLFYYLFHLFYLLCIFNVYNCIMYYQLNNYFQ